MSLEQIEAAIERLPRAELLRLFDRLHERFEDEWDRQIEEDAAAGRFDRMAEAALADDAALPPRLADPAAG